MGTTIFAALASSVVALLASLLWSIRSFRKHSKVQYDPKTHILEIRLEGGEKVQINVSEIEGGENAKIARALKAVQKTNARAKDLAA